MAMKKGQWHRVNGRMVPIKQPRGNQLVEHLTNNVAPRRPGRPPKAAAEEQSVETILDTRWQKMSLRDKVVALLNPEK